MIIDTIGGQDVSLQPLNLIDFEWKLICSIKCVIIFYPVNYSYIKALLSMHY